MHGCMHRGEYRQYCVFADGEPPAARRYGGDVWPVEPAPPDHPWRRMPKHAMTPHLSGTTLDAQARVPALAPAGRSHHAGLHDNAAQCRSRPTTCVCTGTGSLPVDWPGKCQLGRIRFGVCNNSVWAAGSALHASEARLTRYHQCGHACRSATRPGCARCWSAGSSTSPSRSSITLCARASSPANTHSEPCTLMIALSWHIGTQIPFDSRWQSLPTAPAALGCTSCSFLYQVSFGSTSLTSCTPVLFCWRVSDVAASYLVTLRMKGVRRYTQWIALLRPMQPNGCLFAGFQPALNLY